MPRPSEKGGDLGSLLRAHRKARGLTLVALANKAGVHETTLSRWERRKSVPFADELARVLDALGLDQTQRQFFFRYLEAPRAVHLTFAGGTSALPVSSGELLRALRQRAGIPRSAIARAAGVSPNLVVQWEKGECWPGTSHLHAFCYAIGATEEEIVFLSTRQWRHLDPLPLDKDALDAVVEYLEYHDTSLTRAGTYLALAARYHDLFRAGKISDAEAMSVYGSYGYYLGWRLGRFQEAGRVAAPVFTSLTRSRGPLTRGQKEAVILQIEYGDRFQNGSSSTDSARDFARNQTVLDSVADRFLPTQQALLNDLRATAWKKVGDLDAAVRYFERSVALANTPEEVAQRRERFGIMLRRHGRFRHAAALLLPTPPGEKRLLFRISNLLNHAHVFVGLGDFSHAEPYLRQAMALLQGQGLDSYEADANTLCRAIARKNSLLH